MQKHKKLPEFSFPKQEFRNSNTNANKKKSTISWNFTSKIFPKIWKLKISKFWPQIKIQKPKKPPEFQFPKKSLEKTVIKMLIKKIHQFLEIWKLIISRNFKNYNSKNLKIKTSKFWPQIKLQKPKKPQNLNSQ